MQKKIEHEAVSKIAILRPLHMKWWGWGQEDKTFDISHRPHLWEFIMEVVGLDDNPAVTTPPLAFNDITLPASKHHEAFIHCIEKILRPDQIKFDQFERLIHCYGKSFRDLWRIRHGIIDSAPDCILYPESEAQIQSLMIAAHEHNVVLIPFGGGSNIAGCLEARDPHNRTVVILDMKMMNRVLQVDCRSQTATVQPGIMGPDLEKALNQYQMTLGHFPDSFEHSTIGGWVATRSAGMTSDKYGKIEDMIFSLRMVTPVGTIVTRTVPKSSNGIDIKHVCIGSEGILGVITEIVVQIHPISPYREIYGYLFPDFESGVAALHQCVIEKCLPAGTRLNDAEKTALSFAFKSKSSFLKNILGKCMKYYLQRVKHFHLETSALSLVIFEGTDKQSFKQQKKKVHAIYRRFGGVCLGTSPGDSFEKGKYDFPYLRDFAMDRGIVGDVSETSTVWENLLPLYRQAKSAIINAIHAIGSKPWCGCHISHTYHTGASLYFTFVFKDTTKAALAHYQQVKNAVENAFMEGGATFSHHHAVGYEHMPWMESEISATGIQAIQGLKQSLDPKGIMNPGKMLPCFAPSALRRVL